MTVSLKRPQWVTSDETWEFYSIDRFYNIHSLII
jgi:hypothetical protein